MPEASDDLLAAHARKLQERRAGRPAANTGRGNAAGPARRKRRHSAAATRVLSGGLSMSAFLLIVAGLASAPASGFANTATVAPTTLPPAPGVVPASAASAKKVDHRHATNTGAAAGTPATVKPSATAPAPGANPAAGAAPPVNPGSNPAPQAAPTAPAAPSGTPAPSPAPAPAPAAPTAAPAAAGHRASGHRGAGHRAAAPTADHRRAATHRAARHRAAPAAVQRFEMPLTAVGAYWTERRAPAMGSTAHLVLGDADPALADWAVEELERLEQCWSRFRPGSELRRLNAGSGEWVAVSAPMRLALANARTLWEATGGAFDPTTIDALERAGYDRSFELVDAVDAHATGASETARGGGPAPGFGGVDIDVPGSAARLPPGTRLDLGGIGKGLAADLLAQGLVERGARTALVSVGGDLRAYGDPPAPEGWLVPVEDPDDPGRVAFKYPLVRGGLVTSTTRIRRWRRAGRDLHHIIDPATGEPTATSIVAVVAAANEAWWAEGIAKAMIVRGPRDAPALARRAGVRAWCFGADGSCSEVNPPLTPSSFSSS